MRSMVVVGPLRPLLLDALARAPAGKTCLVGRNRAQLPTILVGLLGRPAVCPEPGSAMLSRLAVQ